MKVSGSFSHPLPSPPGPPRTLHVHQELRLDTPRCLALVLIAGAAQRVHFIDEDDGGFVLPRQLKEVPHQPGNKAGDGVPAQGPSAAPSAARACDTPGNPVLAVGCPWHPLSVSTGFTDAGGSSGTASPAAVTLRASLQPLHVPVSAYFSLSPSHFDIRFEDDTEKKVELFASVATALAK